MEEEERSVYEDFRPVVVGCGGVGKSALTLRFLHNYFVKEYDPNPFMEHHRKTILLDDEKVHVNVVDTAGQDDYVTVRDVHLQAGEGYLLVYSITERYSFEAMSSMVTNIQRSWGTRQELTNFDLPLAIIGNKCDLYEEREVSQKEGEEFADEFSCTFFETSAMDATNVEEAFISVLKQMRDRGIVKRAQELEVEDATMNNSQGNNSSCCTVL